VTFITLVSGAHRARSEAWYLAPLPRSTGKLRLDQTTHPLVPLTSPTPGKMGSANG